MTTHISADLSQAIRAHAEQTLETIGSLYRQLHQHPELPFQEHQTSARLADALEAVARDTPGMEVTRGVGGTASSP